MIATILSLLGAFAVVCAMLGFLVYCGKAFDAEARKVEEYGRRT